MAKEVKLLGMWGSPFSRRVELALKLKDVQYEYVEEEDVYNKKSPMLLKYNPVHKKIPVFLHNGKSIAESLVIVEYIDETWKGYPILPENPYDKAMARFWAKFIDEKCRPAIWEAWSGHENERENKLGEAYEHLKTLESALNGKRFFGGDQIGLVDIAANFIGYWLRILQEATGQELLSAEKFPVLFKWTKQFLACSIVTENLPPRDKLFDFFKAHFSAVAESESKAC